MATHLTYADRVKRQWRNDIAAEYSNHREVTIQLANDSKREDIYKLIKETQIPLSYIEGIIQKPGNVVNITIESKKNAIRFADIFRKLPEVKYATAHGEDRTDLTIRWVPIDYPQRHLDNILAEYEIKGPAQLGKDKHGIRDGRRIYRVKKETMERHQLPSYLYLEKIRCAVSYNGQIETCSFCTEQGHKFRDCPKRMRTGNRDADNQDVPMTTTRNVESEEEEPAPPPSESKKVFSALAETIELLREKSTKDMEKSRTGAEPPLKKSPELEPDERPSERRETESRGDKRKNISGSSNDDKEKTEVRRLWNENRTFDFSSWTPGTSGELKCSCGNPIRIKRNKDSRNSLPDIGHPRYCAFCTAVIVRCGCTKFSILHINDRFKPFECRTCEFIYEPNPDDLNSTVM
ncbi:unnamed protein product [Clavelina lepadiformis]|uniref:CCHC-type domain-containing protein n=1 Tax=Clavelina lepadiformis TaxID=159417 RepID=A0ABP0G2I0_CLALP